MSITCSLLTRVIAHGRESLGRRTDRLSLRPIEREIAQGRDRLATLSRRLEESATRRLDDPARKLDGLSRLLETLSYKGTLARGYAVVRSAEGTILTHKAEAQNAAGLEIEFSDGRFTLGGKARPKRKDTPAPEQGSLL